MARKRPKKQLNQVAAQEVVKIRQASDRLSAQIQLGKSMKRLGGIETSPKLCGRLYDAYLRHWENPMWKIRQARAQE